MNQETFSQQIHTIQYIYVTSVMFPKMMNPMISFDEHDEGEIRVLPYLIDRLNVYTSSNILNNKLKSYT